GSRGGYRQGGDAQGTGAQYQQAYQDPGRLSPRSAAARHRNRTRPSRRWAHVRGTGSHRRARRHRARRTARIAAAWLVLDEVPTAAERLGAAVAIAGSFVTVFQPRRPAGQDGTGGTVRVTAPRQAV